MVTLVSCLNEHLHVSSLLFWNTIHLLLCCIQVLNHYYVTEVLYKGTVSIIVRGYCMKVLSLLWEGIIWRYCHYYCTKVLYEGTVILLYEGTVIIVLW